MRSWRRKLSVYGDINVTTTWPREFMPRQWPRSSSSTRTRSKVTRILRPRGSPNLGGEPNFNPEGLATRSHPQYVEGKSLLDMVREDLVAERIAVESYNEIIRYLGDDDPTTRIAMEKILSKEEEHADDMKKLLDTLSKDERFAEHA